MLRRFNKETKNKKVEKKSYTAAAIITNTNTNGATITSISQNKTESYTTTTSSSHASMTQMIERSLVHNANISPHNYITKSSDKIIYRGAPARSAFTSTPLTIKPIKVSYETCVDAKPFIPPVPSTPLPKPSVHTIPTVAAIPKHSLKSNTGTGSQSTASELKTKIQIKVKKSANFFDNDPKSVIPAYKTRSKRRGKLLLINNIKFADGKDVRKGAELDENNISELFKQIGFEVDKCRDLSKKKLMAKVTAFRNDKALLKVDIGAVIVMSHGTGKERSDSTEIACSDGELLPTTCIINEFDSELCPQLNGKPKIFIFQCCRGVKWDIQHDGLPSEISRKLCDTLIAYATVPGFVAHRDPENGTWYIQTICKVFMEHAHDKDVEYLLKIVDNELSGFISAHGSKQTSSFENRGFKTCYFHPQLYDK